MYALMMFVLVIVDRGQRRAARLGAAHAEAAGARMTTQTWSGFDGRALDGLRARRAASRRLAGAL